MRSGNLKRFASDRAGIPGTQPNMSARVLYGYIWKQSRPQQMAICALTMAISPLPMFYLELQRRIVDDALPAHDLHLLALLGGAYFLIISLKSGLKYTLNMTKGTAVERIARDIRGAILAKAPAGRRDASDVNDATLVAMLAAETEDMSGFAGDAFAVPLLSTGTILYVAAYLLWVQPAIAALAILVYFPQMIFVPRLQRSINRLARLRIRMTRLLGHLATATGGRYLESRPVGGFLIQRLYRVRIWIYLRKYLISELGNYLANLGPLIVLTAGGYLVITGRTEVGTLVVFISGLQKISEPWDELVNFYRAISNTTVLFAMIVDRLAGRPHPA